LKKWQNIFLTTEIFANFAVKVFIVTKDSSMIIIGIAGGTGSGKTTVARKIVERLPKDEVALISQDSYYNDTTHLTMDERRKLNFDHPSAFDWELFSKQISDLKNGKAIEQPTYSYIESNRLPETVHVEPKEVIIVEGILALYNKEMRDLMDLKIFVDADADDRLIRVIQRDIVERGRTVEMVLQRYEAVLKPMHQEFVEPTKQNADIIIPQGGHNKRAINLMCHYIERILLKRKNI
jgi:uridine kinase